MTLDMGAAPLVKRCAAGMVNLLAANNLEYPFQLSGISLVGRDLIGPGKRYLTPA